MSCVQGEILRAVPALGQPCSSPGDEAPSVQSDDYGALEPCCQCMGEGRLSRAGDRCETNDDALVGGSFARRAGISQRRRRRCSTRPARRARARPGPARIPCGEREGAFRDDCLRSDDDDAMKRANSPTASSSAPKRNFLEQRAPAVLVHSPPITDRQVSAIARRQHHADPLQSTFIAHATPCQTVLQATRFHAYIRTLVSPEHPHPPADHEMLVYRIMALKPGKRGEIDENDWVVKVGVEQDGEDNSGRAMRDAIEDEGGLDVAVVVSRFYGGTLPRTVSFVADPRSGVMLGPVRFTHIANCVKSAVALLTARLALPGIIAELYALDVAIENLSDPSSSATSARVRYEDDKALDMGKAQRLVGARTKKLEFLQRLQADRAKREEEEAVAEVQRHIAEEGEDERALRELEEN